MSRADDDRRVAVLRKRTELECAIRAVEIHGLAPLLRSWNTRPKQHFGQGAAYAKWAERDHAVQREVAEEMRRHGGASVMLADPVYFRLAGVTARSAMGLRQALTNWTGRAKAALRAVGTAR